jgi:DNA-binding NtrC family response regulator
VEPLSVGSATILVVDDEALVGDLAADILRGRGFRILQANDAEQALALVREHRNIDLIVTDLRMSGMSGAALVEAARELRPSISAIIVSGHVGYAPSWPEGVPFLSKPYLPSRLLAVVDEELTLRAIKAAGRSARHASDR